MNDLDKIFKSYDVRGTYPDQINTEIAYAIGQGYADLLKPKEVVIGHDVRIHSEELKKAIIEGLINAGVNVVDVGLVSTEMIYFATGQFGFDGGICVTASHNPAEWHGAKFVRAEAEPISGESGLMDIKEFVRSGQKINLDRKGKLASKNILDDYCRYVLSWLDNKTIKELKIVANPNFGYNGVVLDRLIELGRLPIKVIKLNYNQDGTFPKGSPNPYLPENRDETTDLVKNNSVDFGVAWDADADRVFFCTDKGDFLEPYYANTLLIKVMLKKYPKSTVLYDPRNTWALIHTINNYGGTPILERVGHSLIKARMRKENAVFCGESSGHTYYRDFWYADSGLIPFLQICQILSEENKSLSNLIEPVMKKFYISGESNYAVSNGQELMKKIEKHYEDGQLDHTDGLSVEFSDWRFNIRISNTEPLLRLNLEAKSKSLVEEKLSEVENIINNK